jgi:hypothetical protein
MPMSVGGKREGEKKKKGRTAEAQLSWLILMAVVRSEETVQEEIMQSVTFFTKTVFLQRQRSSL